MDNVIAQRELSIEKALAVDPFCDLGGVAAYFLRDALDRKIINAVNPAGLFQSKDFTMLKT